MGGNGLVVRAVAVVQAALVVVVQAVQIMLRQEVEQPTRVVVAVVLVRALVAVPLAQGLGRVGSYTMALIP